MTSQPKAALSILAMALAFAALFRLAPQSAQAQRTDSGSVIYVEPSGTPEGDGSVSNPLDLASAFKKGRIRPG
ncbi:MAG: hypothetical protein M3Z85_22160, partial [Acidobacteriota bacterium]|nr:hypothetical protein [Acidobacteriota bacterium]